MPKNGPKTLGNCLPGDVLQRFVSQDDVLRVWQLAWSASVDPELSGFAHPVRFEHGKLVLHCRSPARATRLRHQKMRLIALLQQHPAFQGLMEIDIRTRPQSQDAQAVVEPGPQRQLSSAARSMILGIADSISDPELSASLKRLADRAS
ncbi:MAG TPA: DUF721 domain-containing protein [Acidiferrobacteraceae bacterium]|nr:DUF721 domain-containing protein [Acidiferrobacteraceae bacterium]HEX20044.1 DUF721 domain-containing protein [Acidiferrobacteraceae bacterium]